MGRGRLAAALGARGVDAESLGASEAWILGSGPPGRARITSVRPGPLRRRVARGVVPVVAGFQCVDESGGLRVLGRGGSDATAVHLAAALGAEVCHLVKDVGGIFERDPADDPSAALLPHLRPAELERLVCDGARVVHPEAARVARSRGVRLRVYGFGDPVFGSHGSTVAVEEAAFDGGKREGPL